MDHDNVMLEDSRPSPFAGMKLVSAQTENCDCDGGCDDGNTDNY